MSWLHVVKHIKMIVLDDSCTYMVGHRIHRGWGWRWCMRVQKTGSRENWMGFKWSYKPRTRVRWVSTSSKAELCRFIYAWFLIIYPSTNDPSSSFKLKNFSMKFSNFLAWFLSSFSILNIFSLFVLHFNYVGLVLCLSRRLKPCSFLCNSCILWL